MSPYCAAPDPSLGVALRMGRFLDCQARVLGENGYLAFAGGPVAAALLTASITILVALIGYRLILGARPGLSDGVGWTVRIGVALMLLGSWPAFQTLVYRTVTDGPAEVAGAILRPSGLPAEGIEGRVQLAYDTIRLGSAADRARPEPALAPQRYQFQGAAPRIAVLFLVGTVGLLGAIRICIGFLLAIGPLPILALVLGGAGGLFLGWARTLAGAALAAVAATAVTAVELVLVESELARLQGFRTTGTPEILDPQALAAIIFTGLLMALVTVLAAARIASRLDLRLPFAVPRHADAVGVGGWPAFHPAIPVPAEARLPSAGSARERDMARSLLATVRREALPASGVQVARGRAAHDGHQEAPASGTSAAGAPRPRRGIPRRTRSASRREAL